MTAGSGDPRTRLRVVVAGGGIAGAEALLALRALGGDRVSLTLVSPSEELFLPALSVAEAFARGQAERYPLDALLNSVEADHVLGSLAAVEPDEHRIRLEHDRAVEFDALVLAVGGRAVARVANATTWWPTGDAKDFGGLLRDLEEGYTKRVAFVIPPGAVWPLPLYELALLTAREVNGMGIDDAELTVITPEAIPLSLFGPAAAVAVREELERMSIGLETATVARIDRSPRSQVVLEPTGRRLEVDRVVALPGVEGPRLPGTTHNADGFIRVGRNGRMVGSDAVWAAGDAIAYPVKFGGLATQQADLVAADIAALARGTSAPEASGLHLRGILMTGGAPRPIGEGTLATAGERRRPIWRPDAKVLGQYLTPFLASLREPAAPEDEAAGVAVDEALPGPEHGEDVSFHALWRREQGSEDYLRRLGHLMHDYESSHRQSAALLQAHGHLGGQPS
jgi:sulfide:quinone oxidoreductase